ncbi:hypothetical protein HMPREF9104_02691 [Lentilactobacillus kisonensis F0435]|uniref:Uncharacterized protein n=1 Tax=Lentilactobacillus kisonensis F0435 TaxID=797516 RepID=H1LJ98_9LACO|nr:hypothetical protein HMPREF9104_02691 [Lentilactobacillus kisonensis F0435]
MSTSCLVSTTSLTKIKMNANNVSSYYSRKWLAHRLSFPDQTNLTRALAKSINVFIIMSEYLLIIKKG